MRNPPGVILAEHVLEHFSPSQVLHLAAAAFLSLKPGGVFRVAVPDGYKPSPSYQQFVRAGSTPSGLGNRHIVTYNLDSLIPIFSSVGFQIKLREYFDVEGKFNSAPDAYVDDRAYGKITRSWRHDFRNAEGFPLPWSHNPKSTKKDLLSDTRVGEPVYTSLWFDAVKPDPNCPSIFEVGLA